MKKYLAGNRFWVAIGGAFIGSVALLLMVGSTIAWVGSSDLQVRFRVTAAKTGQPVPNATIHITVDEVCFCDAPDSPAFTLTTDEHGIATQVCTGCMRFGSRNLLQDSVHMHLPAWYFHATAPQYESTEASHLGYSSQYAGLVQRGDPWATVDVPVVLSETDH